MSALKHNPFVSFGASQRRPMGDPLKVEAISHGARYMLDNAPDADIVLLESASALGPYSDAINELASVAEDSNPLFETPALMAAMTHLSAGDKSVRVALVWSEKNVSQPRQLIGLIPYQVKRFYLGLPLSVWSVWTHKYNFLATPLLRRGQEHSALRRFLHYADQSGARMMRFPLFQADGAFGPVLTDIVEERALPSVETARHERAVLDAGMDCETYLSTHMRKKKRKEYNRLWNRMAETGDVAFDTLSNAADLDLWMKNFLLLERSGWKGKRGTALAEQQNDAAFFEELCCSSMSQGKLHVARITLNAQPIAMLVSFISGNCAYAFKIAFDENYARFSPGAWLMMKVIDSFHNDARVSRVDSCAVPDHPMIDHIWAERRQMRAMNVATSHAMSPWFIAYSAHMTRLVDRAWSFMRQNYYRLRKEIERD
ncbi:MAG: GNAT family N-acetyltransferase [Parvibaculum sp.]|nr:GNAT family N-acetyltransferase [Parvibaculum sp.]